MNNKWIIAALLVSPAAFAGGDSLIHWSDFSVTGLYGQNYLEPGEHFGGYEGQADQTTMTLETAGGWKNGDWFAFQDFLYYNDGSSDDNFANYGEYGTRFSASKMFDSKVGFGPLTDVSLALQFEQGSAAASTFLVGIGSDWTIPGFSYFNLNVYHRSEVVAGAGPKGASDGWQLTPVWRVDFGDTGIVFDGYIDWIFSVDDEMLDIYGGRVHADNMVHFNPQLKYQFADSGFLVGIEYDYWKNKYGIDGMDQNTGSVIVKYHF
ncbi:ion channel protein Tsx [Shewanella eurypsychrophilus]|uniref:Ion channel protein Tsx n=1 Tax=Shewanella eurypsychrophilus TaxID=2593656 RepID=A0ABX6V5Y8_9GAMM|nr:MULTISPECIES: ion channel protein Tsx [Shewanella]QFU22747.1 ion channel protein Tsx [Shewanella sp. YLB-09]QPG58036.1 ion channel protein Tsx [Shewanella eurypsychrophilus]